MMNRSMDEPVIHESLLHRIEESSQRAVELALRADQLKTAGGDAESVMTDLRAELILNAKLFGDFQEMISRTHETAA